MTEVGGKRPRAALDAPTAPKPTPVVSDRLKVALALQTSPLELSFAKERADYMTCHGRVLAPVFVDDATTAPLCWVDTESCKLVRRRLSHDDVHTRVTGAKDRVGYVRFGGLPAHRLVVSAALGVPLKHLAQFQVDHKDAVKSNNVITNLGLYLDQRDHALKTLRDNPTLSSRIGATLTVPVQQLDKDTGEVLATFMCARVAGDAVGASAKNIMRSARIGCVTSGFRWRRADALHPRVADLIEKAKEWRPLSLPEGTLVPGYAISDNQLLRDPRGRVTGGSPRAEGCYWNMTVNGKGYQAHLLLCSTFHGPRPFPGAVVLHKDDKYDDVCADDVRWGTQRENATEALATPMEVLDTRTGERFAFPSIADVRRTFSIEPMSVTRAIRERCPVRSHPHLRFAYAGQPMPTAKDWAFKALVPVRTTDTVTGEVRVFDSVAAAATAFGIPVPTFRKRVDNDGRTSRKLPHIRVERLTRPTGDSSDEESDAEDECDAV
jgi:hypothetical protein